MQRVRLLRKRCWKGKKTEDGRNSRDHTNGGHRRDQHDQNYHSYHYSIPPSYIKNWNDLPEDKKMIAYQFTASGCYGVIRYWVENGMKESVESIVEYIERLILTIVADVNKTRTDKIKIQ